MYVHTYVSVMPYIYAYIYVDIPYVLTHATDMVCIELNASVHCI